MALVPSSVCISQSPKPRSYFESGDDLPGEIVLGIVVFVIVVLLFVEAEGEQIGCFVVSVGGIDEVLNPRQCHLERGRRNGRHRGLRPRLSR